MAETSRALQATTDRRLRSRRQARMLADCRAGEQDWDRECGEGGGGEVDGTQDYDSSDGCRPHHHERW